MPESLSTRALNRALLARQLLLRRERRPAVEVVEHLVGLQAQAPMPPYYQLWSRVADFDPAELSTPLTERAVVRGTAMRGTIHLLTAADYLAQRPLVQPMLERSLPGQSFGKAVAGMDLAALAAAGRELLGARPRTPAELGALLAERWPDRDGRAMASAVQVLTALVQVPPRGLWGRGGQPTNTTVEAWLGRPVDATPSAERMVLRYLGAFGPAAVADVQAWCGLTRLGEVVEGLRPRLRAFRDERGRELVDLPDAPRPDPDTPAPARLLGEFDNVLLSHADRTRILGDTDRGRVMTVNGLVRGTLLVDGFVRGSWKVTAKRDAVVDLEPFRPVAARATAALEREAELLLDFAVPDARSRDIRWQPAP
ncbi:Winged helix DNA-binding domain-containing protein [Amycolatopsis arida]|uniref:Winged helix DNA-binding domain-containing protein n=1 Tax=Amycolatopsis arida TaxID=587909 RepID=A0A1I5YHD8_9PSEU|nr:winged helix DNA-binding domain-containing protein [Amycolatopsis arida]TDX90516.1 winged helix DNA-binding protein [Amycolatopsis arida]SFQ43595.1 Winged helix DNA-binding domain-containing protein [Amycolatopsis arida]